MQKVKYIGKRNPWTDRLYSSGLTFEPNQVREVPDDVAKKLLRHVDLFETTDEKAKAEPKAEPKDDTIAQLEEGKATKTAKQKDVNQLSDLHDQINQMEKDSLERFAKEHFNQDIDKRIGIDKLRDQVRGWLDQYGAA